MTKEGSRYQIIIGLVDGLTIIINEKGHVYQKRQSSSRKTLPNGYTIVYDEHAPPKVLHPNGGLTIPTQSFSNPNGLGLVYPNKLK